MMATGKRRKDLYSTKNIRAKNTNYMMLIGMRSNGKSFAVKHDCIEDAWRSLKEHDGNECHAKFIYLRRWDADIKESYVTEYFSDMTEAKNGYKAVNTITEGQWDSVVGYQGYLYFARLDETSGRYARSARIGRYLALNMAERYKSQAFIGYKTLIFEEFITDSMYLENEPKRVFQIISTIFRDENADIFMIANTLSRVIPYVNDWGLKNLIHMKPGTIDVYHFTKEDGTVIDFAVENCEVVKTKSKMFFGNAAKQIQGGQWDVDEYPGLEKPKEFYERLYELKVKYQDFTFCLQLLYDPKADGPLVYIYPFTSNRKIERVISDDFSVNPMHTACLKSKIRAERIINECMHNGKVCYSDNLTGTDFKAVYAHFKFGGILL